MKIGIIQTRGLGDIIIAAPIAMFYVNQGAQVHWPIDSNFATQFQEAFPRINFIPIDPLVTGDKTADYFYNTPLEILNSLGCEKIFPLYSSLTGFDFANSRFQSTMTFDAYKYAVANVPFLEKWNFHPRRNLKREAQLIERLQIAQDEPYVVFHDQGSDFTAPIEQYVRSLDCRAIRIEPISSSIFDWLGVLENCRSAFVVDSCYANMIEQLNLPIEKSLYLRSPLPFTPIFKNKWTFY